MSKISVTTIAGLTSGGDANTVKIESGDDFVVDTDVLKVDSSNNRVGIGTASPTQATLHVAGGGVPARFESTSSATTYVQFGASGTSNYGQIAMNGNDMTLRTAYTDRMKIDGSGNIMAPAITLGNGTTYANNNTLDDYEEGTWTPTITAAVTPPNSITSGSGVYTKIGNQVMVYGVINNINISGASGNALIQGLPFPCQTGISGGQVPGILYANNLLISGLATASYAVIEAPTGNSYVQIRLIRNNNSTAASVGLNTTYFVDDTTDVRFQITYRTGA